MRQLTIRGFDEELASKLRQLAQQQGISLNKAALQLMRKGAGLDRSATPGRTVGSSLDELIGSWSEEEEREFLEAVEVFEQIDKSLWS